MIDGSVAWLADSDPYVLAWLVGAALAWGALYHLAHGTTVRRRLPPGTVTATVTAPAGFGLKIQKNADGSFLVEALTDDEDAAINAADDSYRRTPRQSRRGSSFGG